MRGNNWQRIMLLGALVGLVAACEPQPPLEVVTEAPDFTTGITVQPIAGPTPDPVQDLPDGSPTAVAEVTPEGDAVTEDPFSVVVDNNGLQERLPNTCKLENYQQYSGQSAAVLASSGLDRAWRIIAPNTIVTQEYNPARLNFHTNASGVIQRITCG